MCKKNNWRVGIFNQPTKECMSCGYKGNFICKDRLCEKDYELLEDIKMALRRRSA